jgi:hypothetical protein
MFVKLLCRLGLHHWHSLHMPLETRRLPAMGCPHGKYRTFQEVQCCRCKSTRWKKYVLNF